MTCAARDKLQVLYDVIGSDLLPSTTPDEGCTFRSHDGRYRGAITPTGFAAVFDLAGEEPGVLVRLVDDGHGGWQLVRDQ